MGTPRQASSLASEATDAAGKRHADKPVVLIVDDHPLWRQTLCTLIERSDIASRLLEAGDGIEAVDAVKRYNPAVVVMDIALPGQHGVDATAEIVAARPDTRVLILSSSDDEEQVIEAVRAGATGYLLKTAGPADILDGIRRVHAGELVFPPSLAKLLHEELRGGRKAAAGPLASLTEREIDVLRLMADGRTNETIGEGLFLSSKTVEAHVTSIFNKLGLDAASGGHRRVLAVIAYLGSARSKGTPRPEQA